MPAPNIATERVLLTPLRAADAEAFFAYRSLPEVSRYQGWAPSCLRDAVRVIEGLQDVEFDVPGTWFQYGIRLRGSGRLAGDVGVHFIDAGRQVEIGFTLAPEFQGRGLATEAVTGLLDYLFGTLGKHRVTASVDPRNHASVRLLERLGMRKEAHFRQSVQSQGGWADDIVFARLASEWRTGAGLSR